MRNKIITLLLLLVSLCATASPKELSLSADGSHFVNEQGEPFLWLGDTAWELFHRLDREQACRYLDDRAAKGFTVIQAVAIAEMDGLGTPNPYGEVPLVGGDPASINDRYFEHVDFVVDEASRRGLYIAMLPTWGDKVAAVYHYDSPIFDSQSAYAYGRYLSERYADKPIVWVLGGDRDIRSDEVKSIWDSMAAGIKSGSSKGLLTFHPSGGKGSWKWFAGSEWIDFHGCQSGHTRRYDDVYRYSLEAAQLTPRRPFVNLEPAYEGIGLKFWLYRNPEARGLKRSDYIADDGLLIDSSLYVEGCFEAYDIRVAAYWTLLSGAAGYTYGNNAIWQMFSPYAPCSISPINYWYDALESEGAYSMSHLATLFARYPIGSFSPDESLLCGERAAEELYIAAAKGREGDFALVYIAQGREVEINIEGLTLEGVYSWFNPSTGLSSELSQFDTAQPSAKFAPASSGDWLLIIE